MKNLDGDTLTHRTAVAAVLAVAVVAAWVSYRHAVTVVTAHGEPGVIGHLYPVGIDGLIVAASMVLLDSARHQEDAPKLALWLLGSGIGGTLAANVLAGTASGWLGAIVAAWPALAFIGSYELLMMLVRASARRAAKSHEDDTITQTHDVALTHDVANPVSHEDVAKSRVSQSRTHARRNVARDASQADAVRVALAEIARDSGRAESDVANAEVATHMNASGATVKAGYVADVRRRDARRVSQTQ